jgi:hypothetical protein
MTGHAERTPGCPLALLELRQLLPVFDDLGGTLQSGTVKRDGTW